MTPPPCDRVLSLLPGKQLVRESRWMRVYRLEEKCFYYESKFLTDGLQLTEDELRREWDGFTPEEKCEFALAYNAKANISTEDHKILQYLMEAGSDEIWPNIALALTRLPDKDRVLAFLIARIEGTRYSPNYLQALEVLADPRAVEALTRSFHALQTRISAAGEALTDESSRALHNFLYCCRALVKLAGSKEATAALDRMESFPDERIQEIAKRLKSGI